MSQKPHIQSCNRIYKIVSKIVKNDLRVPKYWVYVTIWGVTIWRLYSINIVLFEINNYF